MEFPLLHQGNRRSSKHRRLPSIRIHPRWSYIAVFHSFQAHIGCDAADGEGADSEVVLIQGIDELGLMDSGRFRIRLDVNISAATEA